MGTTPPSTVGKCRIWAPDDVASFASGMSDAAKSTLPASSLLNARLGTDGVIGYGHAGLILRESSQTT